MRKKCANSNERLGLFIAHRALHIFCRIALWRTAHFWGCRLMKILLLEPNRLLAQQYCSFFTQKGHEVAWREDAQSGIVAADESAPDIAIVELLLAGHSGVEFLYEFRSYADWLNVPAIILSSAPKSSTGVPDSTFEELGVSSYLYKPETSLKQLEHAIKRATASSKPV